MWVRGQNRSLVNFDYVTQVEARVVEASYSTADREPKYEVIAYRRPPAQDAILLNMLDAKMAAAAVDWLAGAFIAESPFIDMLELADEARRQVQKDVVDAVATVDASAIVDAVAVTPT
jgi:hypothetical protein